jgi:hypothetical protein
MRVATGARKAGRQTARARPTVAALVAVLCVCVCGWSGIDLAWFNPLHGADVVAIQESSAAPNVRALWLSDQSTNQNGYRALMNEVI